MHKHGKVSAPVLLLPIYASGGAEFGRLWIIATYSQRQCFWSSEGKVTSLRSASSNVRDRSGALFPALGPLPSTPQHTRLVGRKVGPSESPWVQLWESCSETRAKEMLQADPISFKWIFWWKGNKLGLTYSNTLSWSLSLARFNWFDNYP